MISIRKDYQTFIQETHNQNTGNNRQDVLNTLSQIQNDIQKNGDVALCNYTQKFDKATLTPETLFVTEKEIQDAYQNVPKEFIEAIKAAHQNILEFHENQKPSDWEKTPRNGVVYGMQFSPIDSVGLYVPGGRAPYPSTVLMDAIPAKIAGVNRIIIATPPSADGNIPPQILVAADCCGVSQILKAGGSQAIFALAHGTKTIKKVNKIMFNKLII
jgi:histidinol dehydrogenase